MIKVTLTSTGGMAIWIPPESITHCFLNNGGPCTRIRVRDGTNWDVIETPTEVDLMITAAYHRRQL